jgi:hypothetical protein
MNEPNYEGYWKSLDDLNRRQISNSETYDKSLLTLSTALLGISLTFIKDAIDIDTAGAFCLLYVSWFLFSGTIITVMVSFIYGQLVIEELKISAKKYFIDGDKSENDRSQTLYRRLNIVNTLSGIFFVVGVICLALFVGINLEK